MMTGLLSWLLQYPKSLCAKYKKVKGKVGLGCEAASRSSVVAAGLERFEHLSEFTFDADVIDAGHLGRL